MTDRTLTVLVVDDDDSIRWMTKLSLEHIGNMRVLEAPDGETCLTIAASELPDCILLDAIMPGLDGAATLAALRADATTAAIPVIFLTALDAGPELDRLVVLGASGAIHKPFEPWSLPAELLRLLGR